MRGNPEGISKELRMECGKGGKPASRLSTLSILCHFHGLLFAGMLCTGMATSAMGPTAAKRLS
jgi:hypothetical protein